MKMKLFDDITDSPMDFDMGFFSQENNDANDVDEIEMLMTPIGKTGISKPVIFDEDSGLGIEKLESDSSSEDEEFQIRRPKQFTGYSKKSCQFKRPLFNDEDDDELALPMTKSRRNYSPMKRSNSYTYGESFAENNDEEQDEDIKHIVDRFVDEDDLIADGSTSYCLPTVRGKHSDLKSITPKTMSDVLNGDYDDVIGSYRIIDCRYPYEYDGGHIKGAENLYTQESVLDLLQSQQSSSPDGKRHILIFHCEFSSERGPKMVKFLRNKDREINTQNYPALNYPEVYLLHNGYKLFYENHKEQCEPMAYKPMLHQDHGDDLRHFRVKSKTFAYGEKRRIARQKNGF